MNQKISLIITNWNGISLLKKNFETVVKNSPEVSEIIVVDNGSEDGSVEYLKSIKKKHSFIKIIQNPDNKGFGRASNQAVKACTGDLVVLLNNDILPHPEYLRPAIKHFSDPTLYGVGFAELGNENFANIFWKDGYIQYNAGHSNITHISGWVSGGGAIVRREVFLKLGGFDPIYAPFYSEDLDIGYRAWKSGYKLLWEPASVIEHKHESSTSRFPKRFSDYVKERNRLLVVWRNISDKDLLSQNRWTLLGRILTGPNYFKIILAAKRQIKSFPAPVVFPQLSDREIFSLFLNHD